MNTERDTTRVVRSWLESGSTAIPDRVVDAVLAELPSRPQRRSRWSLWRSLNMKPIVTLAAGAAVIVLAVVLGSRFLPADSGVGAPPETGSPAASGAPSPVSGQVTFTLGDTPVTVDVDASADGSALSGTAVITFDTDEFTIDLECSRQFDDTTWILGGTTTESTTDNSPVGSHSAVLIRDGEPQELILWFEDPPPADDCAGFVDALQDDAIVNAGFGPATEGEISLP